MCSVLHAACCGVLQCVAVCQVKHIFCASHRLHNIGCHLASTRRDIRVCDLIHTCVSHDAYVCITGPSPWHSHGVGHVIPVYSHGLYVIILKVTWRLYTIVLCTWWSWEMTPVYSRLVYIVTVRSYPVIVCIWWSWKAGDACIQCMSVFCVRRPWEVTPQHRCLVYIVTVRVMLHLYTLTCVCLHNTVLCR